MQLYIAVSPDDTGPIDAIFFMDGGKLPAAQPGQNRGFSHWS